MNTLDEKKHLICKMWNATDTALRIEKVFEDNSVSVYIDSKEFPERALFEAKKSSFREELLRKIKRISFSSNLKKLVSGFLMLEYEDSCYTVNIDFSNCSEVEFDSFCFSEIAFKKLIIPPGSKINSNSFSFCSFDELVIGKGSYLEKGSFYDCDIKKLKIESNVVLGNSLSFCFCNRGGTKLNELNIEDSVSLLCASGNNKKEKENLGYLMKALPFIDETYLYYFSTESGFLTEEGKTKKTFFRLEDYFDKETTDFIMENNIPILKKYFLDSSQSPVLQKSDSLAILEDSDRDIFIDVSVQKEVYFSKRCKNLDLHFVGESSKSEHTVLLMGDFNTVSNIPRKIPVIIYCGVNTKIKEAEKNCTVIRN